MKNSVFIVCFFAFHFVVGQNSTHDTYLGIGTGRRTIAKTEKNQELPKTIDSTVKISEVKYYLEPKKHETDFNAVPIKAAKLKKVSIWKGKLSVIFEPSSEYMPYISIGADFKIRF